MYKRMLRAPERAFFLFGPRGTGKSSWIRETFTDAYIIDLLPPHTTLMYQKNTSLLQNEVLALDKRKWIVIDEIQKVPELTDGVHDLMENHGYKKFILTGSSARKLKRGNANMLGGRALLKTFFPLNAQETAFSVPHDEALSFGMLPLSVTAKNNNEREEYLTSYLVTYINEEIKHEGLIRNIGSFSRFLDIAALAAGTQLNLSSLSRDAGISRDTLRGYFEVFEDTLLGSWLHAYRPRAKVKEVTQPKFYWFDSGVLNAAAGGFIQPLPGDFKGILFEHLIFHELRSYKDYSQSKGSLGFWRTPSGSEIDFVWWYGDRIIAIEVKSSAHFKYEYLKGIKSFSETQKLAKSFLVYRDEKELKVDETWILPVSQFLKRLHKGEIIGI